MAVAPFQSANVHAQSEREIPNLKLPVLLIEGPSRKGSVVGILMKVDL